MTETLPARTSRRAATGAPLALVACAATLVVAAARAVLPGAAGLAPELLPEPVAVAGAVLGGLAVLASGGGRPRRAVRGVTWGACALLLAVTADGIAFDVVGVMVHAVARITGDPLMLPLTVDWPGIAVRVLSGATAALLGLRALAAGRAARRACTCCGGVAAPGRWAPGWPAYTACALALGYAAEKVYWGLGGTLGLARPDAFGDVHLWAPGLGDTAVLALVGTGIALALVRPWGRRLPSWLPLSGAVLGSLMLVPVGIMGAYGTVSQWPPSGDLALEPWVFLIEYPWFLAWGLALGAAAVAFRRRSRGPCGACSEG